jgi:hypothetical protein
LCLVGSLNDAGHFGGGVLQARDAGAPLPNRIARFECDNALTPPSGARYARYDADRFDCPAQTMLTRQFVSRVTLRTLNVLLDA